RQLTNPQYSHRQACVDHVFADGSHHVDSAKLLASKSICRHLKAEPPFIVNMAGAYCAPVHLNRTQLGNWMPPSPRNSHEYAPRPDMSNVTAVAMSYVVPIGGA